MDIAHIIDKRFNRVEIIEKDAGRVYVNLGVKGIEWSIQDNGNTLKIFINYNEE